jgi:4-amino-4-deoxy-L-arabinose transferase-like glycosyltransferase
MILPLAEDFVRHRRALLAVFSVVLFFGLFGEAAVKLLWYDELTTFYIDRQASLNQVLSLVYSGQDLNPPLFHILTWASLKLLGNNALAVRLPAMIGFWIMCLCLYSFVARRTSPLHGFIALLIPCLTGAYTYAFEARPYGLVLAFCGLALVMWQRAAEDRPRAAFLAGLAVSLAAAVSVHYYAVLLYLPLAAGEGVRWLERRRPDWRLWAAVAISLTPLLFSTRLIAMHGSGKAVFWAKAKWTGVPDFYDFLLRPALIPAAVVIVLLAMAWRPAGPLSSQAKTSQAKTSGPFAHEMAAAVALALLPVAAMLLAKLYTGAFVDRYALAAVAGVSVVLGFAPAIYEQPERRPSALAAIVLFTYFLLAQGAALPRFLSGPPVLEKFSLPGESPVVVTDGRVFLQLVHYCPQMRPRLYFLADSQAALKYIGYTTVDDALPSMTSYVSMNVEPYGQFVAAHKEFQVYGPYGTPYDWTIARLVDDGAHLELQGRFGPYMLFHVKAP